MGKSVFWIHAALATILLLCFPRLTRSASCTSTIPEAQRIDCAGDVAVATVGICRSRDCVWCATSTPNIPYCFYDNSSIASLMVFLKRQCQSCSYCPYSKDCHPEQGASEKACLARGCKWCNYTTDISCGPMCVYSGDTNLAMSRSNCSNCSSCARRIDCHPETGADYGKCLARGCIWCPPLGNSTDPSCIFGTLPNLITTARTKCETCASCQARVDCHPEPGANSTSCLSRNCIWCPTSADGQPHCVYGGSTSVSQNYCRSCGDCNTKIPCLKQIKNPSQLQCENYGCLWCPFKSFGATKCVQKLM